MRANIDFAIQINNCPETAKERQFIIARKVSREFWFYSASDDQEKAYETADNLGSDAFVIPNVSL